MAKKQHWTYFNDAFKHRKVDEFCAWYLKGNSDKVKVTNPVTRQLTEEERQRIKERNPELYGPNAKIIRVESVDFGVGYPRYEHTSDPARAGPLKVPTEITEQRDDARFKNLKALVYQYAGITQVANENREALEQELWSLIGQLEDEKRIDGGKGFSLENYGDSVITRLDSKIDNLTAQYQSTVDFLKQTNPAFIAYQKSKGK